MLSQCQYLNNYGNLAGALFAVRNGYYDNVTRVETFHLGRVKSRNESSGIQYIEKVKTFDMLPLILLYTEDTKRWQESHIIFIKCHLLEIQSDVSDVFVCMELHTKSTKTFSCPSKIHSIHTGP